MEHLLLVSIGVVYATSPPPSWTHPTDRLQYTPTIAKPSGFVILGIIFIYFSQASTKIYLIALISTAPPAPAPSELPCNAPIATALPNDVMT